MKPVCNQLDKIAKGRGHIRFLINKTSFQSETRVLGVHERNQLLHKENYEKDISNRQT